MCFSSDCSNYLIKILNIRIILARVRIIRKFIVSCDFALHGCMGKKI